MNLDAAAIRLGHKVLSYRINQSLRNSPADYFKRSARLGQHTNDGAAGFLHGNPSTRVDRKMQSTSPFSEALDWEQSTAILERHNCQSISLVNI
jgi:hypothetical protein